ncbi:MAG TPA: phage tail protein [Candidatus Dormibacteraeota bacterium]|nr:phage tail protein [Candidatus Dormibacteraeota bacterium]
MIAPATTADPKRGLVGTLISPHPLGQSLPGLYQEDDFTQRFVSAFDAALAPIFAALDNFPAYLDPWLAPEDFLEWLASWFGIVLDETWSPSRRRALVSRAFEFYRMRGTASGLKEQVEVLTGGAVDLHETGGVAISTTAGGALPGSPNFAILVRVTVDDPSTINQARLDALVMAAKPAHVTHKVEIVKRAKVTDAVEVTTG